MSDNGGSKAKGEHVPFEHILLHYLREDVGLPEWRARALMGKLLELARSKGLVVLTDAGYEPIEEVDEDTWQALWDLVDEQVGGS